MHDSEIKNIYYVQKFYVNYHRETKQILHKKVKK